MTFHSTATHHTKMLNKIFWDLDETLAHVQVNPRVADIKSDDQTDFTLDDSFLYRATIRDGASELVNYSRELVGPENVWVCTTSVKSYAEKIIELADLQIPSEQVLYRSIVDSYYHRSRRTQVGDRLIPQEKHSVFSLANVLLDNKRVGAHHLAQKMCVLGISPARVFHVKDFYENNSKLLIEAENQRMKMWLRALAEDTSPL